MNTVFSFGTAAWYAMRGLGSWNITQLKVELVKDSPKASPHTISNGILELAGTLAATPIGDQLGQGIVQSGRPRLISRAGLANPSKEALALALELLFESMHTSSLPLRAGLLWPWTVFGSSVTLAHLDLIDHPLFRWDSDSVSLAIS